MANNTSDDEINLMNELATILGGYPFSNTRNMDIHHAVQELEQLIKQREEQAALEARIDELEMLEGLKGKVYMHGAILDQSQLGDTNDQRIDYRIVELRLSTLTGAAEIDKLTTTHKGDQ